MHKCAFVQPIIKLRDSAVGILAPHTRAQRHTRTLTPYTQTRTHLHTREFVYTTYIPIVVGLQYALGRKIEMVTTHECAAAATVVGFFFSR